MDGLFDLFDVLERSVGGLDGFFDSLRASRFRQKPEKCEETIRKSDGKEKYA